MKNLMRQTFKSIEFRSTHLLLLHRTIQNIYRYYIPLLLRRSIMKKSFLKAAIVIGNLVTCSYLYPVADYKNSAEVQTAIKNAYEKMIPASQNIFKIEYAVWKTHADAWKRVMSDVTTYIKTALEKERLNKKSLIGISQDNINLFNDAQKVVKIFSDDVIETIIKLANTKVRDVEWERDLAALSQRTSMLKELQKKLAPKTLDLQISKDIKNILLLLTSLLEKAVPKIAKDYTASLSNQKQDLARDLIKAIETSRVDDVKNILNNKALDINYMSVYEKTGTISALGMALEKGNNDIIDLVLAKKPKLDTVAKIGTITHSALSMAIMNNAVADNVSLVQKILSQSPKPNLEKTYMEKGVTYSALKLIAKMKNDKKYMQDKAFKNKIDALEQILRNPHQTLRSASLTIDPALQVVQPKAGTKQRPLSIK